MVDNERLTFLTTSMCNGGCPSCSVTPWMKSHANYQMDILDVFRFCEFSQRSDYHFKRINLCGGEPLLWVDLIIGARTLKHYDIVDDICVVTNGLMIVKERKDFLNELVKVVDTIQISRYIGNEDNIKYALDHLPKIHVSPQIKRPVSPDAFIEDSLPADCICRGRGFAEGKVTVCSPMKSMGFRFPQHETELKEGFLSHFDNIERENQPYCQVCVANRRIHGKIEWIDNNVR